MWKRHSFVQNANVYGLQSSSVFHIGDSNQIVSKSNVMAVQREWEIFFGNEGNFNNYSVFSKPFPVPKSPISPPLIKRYNMQPNINVKTIGIKGISASAIVQIGNTTNANMQSRVFHLRQLSDKYH